jgi:hypothetical protein
VVPPPPSLLRWARAMPARTIAAKSVKAREEVAKERQHAQRWQMSRFRQWRRSGKRESPIQHEFLKSYGSCTELSRMDEFTHTPRDIPGMDALKAEGLDLP